MARLSVIVITKNEAKNIRGCLESAKWADEIIVVDSGSDDDTVKICRELGAQVYTTADWPGFGMQKNRALSHATGKWILSLDADERITADLHSEIDSVINDQHDRYAGYRMPRLSSFFGRYMRHSGWHPDYVTRLFRRGSARFSDDLVHEHVIVDGKTGMLKQSILHESIADAEELLAKINRYSSAGALMLYNKKRTATLKGAIIRALWAFLRSYILRFGFLDGREGFMLAVSTAEGTYYRYVKLMLMTNDK